MSGRIIGIEFKGPFIFALGSRPVAVVIIIDMGQRNVSFGKCVIDFQGLERGGLGFWHRLIRRHASDRVRGRQKIVSVSQTAVRQREVRISFYRLLKIFEGLLHPILGPLVPIESSL